MAKANRKKGGGPSPREERLQRNNKRLLNLVLVLIAFGLILFHHQGRVIARYEAHFETLSIKSGQLYLASLRQKIDYLSILAEHDIIDPAEWEAARDAYAEAVRKEKRKVAMMREKHGL